MVVVFVVLTFAVFIAVDAYLNRNRVPVAAPEPAVQKPATARTDIVGGYYTPDSVRYHPGHTWVHRERKNVHRIGADAFASALIGDVEAIELPKPGHWVRQGQKAIEVVRGGEKFTLVCPLEGEVMEVNAEALKNPKLLREDPYGKGWLMTIFAPDEEGPARNLLPANLVRGWMQDAADRLFRLQPQLAGATAADGGQPVPGATTGVTAQQLSKEFFLS